MKSQRAIIHVDMDAFYASVEQRDNPQLRGRPVMVGGSSARGVVAAASYEARQYGVRSAMPALRARRLCPAGVFVPPRFSRYREVSEEIFGVFRSLTDQVEGVSLDEAFLDLTGAVGVGQSLLTIGTDIKRRIAELSGLTASVGMSHNKLLAKIASDYDKPDGFVYIAPDEVRRYLDPLPVQRIWGIGPRTAERLNDAGIYTAGQLRQTGRDVMESLFGEHGHDLVLRAAGVDERPVKPTRPRRSISQESTFDEDIHDLEALRPLLDQQAADVASTLSRKGLYARTITLKLRSSGFATMTRSQSLSGYTRDPERIAGTAWEMLRHWTDWRQEFAIRLIGVGVSGLASRPDETDLLDQ